MKFSKLLKYSIRFFTLQIFLTYFLVFYVNNFLISNERCDNCVGFSFRMQINNNLWEDRNRFFPFVSENYVYIEYFLIFFVFIFLLLLYSTKFYTYVNELSYSLDRSYLDEYLSIYLMWTSSFMVFLTLFRVANLISRGYLILLTLIVPLFLLLFRNSEYLSSLLGRSITNENFITFNLEENSGFRNLRIMTFRNSVNSIQNIDFKDFNSVIYEIDKLNKIKNLNLIIFNLANLGTIPKELETYLINLNKKVLIISEQKINFNNNFIYREEIISGSYLVYFNNDIQYGSKYILKRVIDLFLASIGLILFFPFILLIMIYIYILDGSPVLIKQNRVGLHGKQFFMYKFRTMKNNAHQLREELKELNKNDEIIFKIENDPRIIKGTEVLRNFSLDELPQLLNVIKGDMSLVGPRPLFEEDTLAFNQNYMRRLNVLPGITGLLQINERNTTNFETWYKYDIEYIENWSIYQDLKIIFKTPLALFKSKIKGL